MFRSNSIILFINNVIYMSLIFSIFIMKLISIYNNQLSFSSRNFNFIFFNIKNVIFKIMLILKLANKKIFSKKYDFFFKFYIKNKDIIILNIFSLYLSIFLDLIMIYYCLEFIFLLNFMSIIYLIF